MIKKIFFFCQTRSRSGINLRQVSYHLLARQKFRGSGILKCDYVQKKKKRLDRLESIKKKKITRCLRNGRITPSSTRAYLICSDWEEKKCFAFEPLPD